MAVLREEQARLSEKYNKELGDVAHSQAQKEQDLRKKHQSEVETLHADIDRLAIVRMKERLENDSDLNHHIIQLQREVQQQLNELKES